MKRPLRHATVPVLLALVLVSNLRGETRDIREVDADLVVPPLSAAAAAAGKRFKEKLAE